MRKFLERALKKFDKLDPSQLRLLLSDLASENERMLVVLDSMSDAVVVADDANRITLANKAAERLLTVNGHHDPHERLVWEAIGDPDLSAFVQDALERQYAVADKEFVLGESGSMKILSVCIEPLVREGHIQGNIVHAVDITDKRSREARLRRAESLASLTTLAAGVAHEIKNPLGSIGIHIQLIQKALAEEQMDRERVLGFVDVVNEEVDRLNRIVVDFLFAVRPVDVQPERSDINQIIRDLMEFLRYEVKEHGVETEAYLAEDLPDLDLDQKFVKQALMNLVKNSLAAMPDGGRLTFSTERRGDEVLLRISDTGEGIPEENLGKIFEPYFTTKDFGSGIGLTLVYKVVKEHKGEISVVSHPGEGTTVSILFPIPQREQHLLSWSGEEREV
ncbi:MAG: two-component system sensor histidine kinase NtrB [Spirochaetota bacterium]